LAAPEHDWINEEPELVDEHGGDELATSLMLPVVTMSRPSRTSALGCR
jgi:hypothetical protein